MKNCDICNKLIDNGKSYSSTQMREVAQSGYRPQLLNNLARTDEDKHLLYNNWVKQVLNDSTNWTVCLECDSAIHKFMALRLASDNKPNHVIIFGKDHFPEENNALLLYHTWVNQRSPKLGRWSAEVAIEAVAIHQNLDTQSFIRLTEERIKGQYPDYYGDSLLLLDRESGRDLALYALWPPSVANRIRNALGVSSNESGRTTEKLPRTDKKGWKFWRK